MQISGKLKGTLVLFIIIAASPFLFVQGQTVNEQSISLNAGPKDWTVLIYLCGDNNLEYFAFEDLNEMEAAGGTTADVNIVVMFDRCEYEYETPEYPNDWSETRYYTIVGDSNTYSFTSPMNVSLGEVNMGDPQSLDDFIDWGLTNYPSDKTALILWDHGNGLDGVCWDEDNGDDNLLIDEISTALDGYYFDFLGFDACHMGQFEVMYELQEYCEIYTASMLNEPGAGWDYYNTLSSLIANPSMDASELAQNVCEDYVQYYSGYDVDVTLSAYNTSAFTDVDNLVDDFVLSMDAYLDVDVADVFEARISAYSDLFPDTMCDIEEFFDNIQTIPDPSLNAAASALSTRLDELLVVSESSFTLNPYGMWIFIPAVPYHYFNDFYIYANQSIVNSYYNNYYDLDFVINTDWDNFLYKWKEELEIFLPEVSTSTPVTDTLPVGTYTYLHANLPDPGAGNAYLATLTMDFTADYDLYAWSEEYHFGLPNGFELIGQNPIDTPESLLMVINGPVHVFFLIHAFDGFGDYTLQLELVEYSDDAFEENDDFLSAAPIETNTVYDLVSNDVDFFSVELTAFIEVEIFLNFNYDVVDLDLYLFADEDTMLDWSEEYTNNEYINYIPSYTGTYYIQVNYYTGAIGEDYTLEIAESEGPVVTSLSHTPYTPESGETITVTCNIYSIYDLVEVTLTLSYDSGAWVYFTMTISGSSYSVSFTPPDGTEIVQYYVYVEDNQGNFDESQVKNIGVESGSTAFVTFPWFLMPLLLLGLTIANRLLISKKRK